MSNDNETTNPVEEEAGYLPLALGAALHTGRVELLAGYEGSTELETKAARWLAQQVIHLRERVVHLAREVEAERTKHERLRAELQSMLEHYQAHT